MRLAAALCVLMLAVACSQQGTTPAEVKLALYHGRWNNSIEPIFDEFAY